MNVSAEPGVMYDLFDSMGEHPIECMQVMTEDEPGQWQNLYFSEVKGFTYERGHEYVLRVKRTILANPPQDASNRTYELVRILADKKVDEVAQPVEKEVKSESDIEYEQQCPIEKYAIAKGGEYIVDADGKMTYVLCQALILEALRYHLILVNVYKRGIQKVEFTIKKK